METTAQVTRLMDLKELASLWRVSPHTIRAWVRAEVPNVHAVGRNGMHKYNNQDHSMMTAMLAVRNMGGESFNLWNVNSDAEYHEESSSEDKSGRLMPKRVDS